VWGAPTMVAPRPERWWTRPGDPARSRSTLVAGPGSLVDTSQVVGGAASRPSDPCGCQPNEMLAC
jgi:hypothetical protein